MTTAVVILNWNGVNYLRQFLPILKAYSALPGVEIVVADNASTDNSMEMMAQEFPEIRTLVLAENYGFAGGYNKALQQVEADYYVLLNSDVEVTPDWLSPLLDYMNGHKDVAACQPKIRAYHRRTHFEHAGAAGGYIDRFGFPFCRGRMFAEVEEDRGQYDDIKDVFWATGACLMVRSEVYHAVGGLDDDFFAHMEEIDLCWRIRSRGYRIVCVPQSVVYHIGGGTLNTESPRKTYLNFRNNQLMLYKNLPEKDLRSTLRSRFVFDYVAALQMLLTGKVANARSVVQARRDFKTMLPKFELKRKENLLYVTKMLSDIYPESIVLKFYLKGKKTFSSLSFSEKK